MATLKMTTGRLVAGIAAAMGISLAGSGAAQAQGVKIIRENQLGQKITPTTVFNNSSLFTSVLQPKWNALRPGLEQKMRQELGKPDRFAKGVTFRKVTCNLSRDVSDIQVYPSNGFIQMRFRLNGNYLKITSTTPGPLGKWADPTFEIRFDALFIVDITYPGKDLQFKAGTAKVSIQKVRFDSQGIVADVIKLVNNIANFFTKKLSGKKVLISAIEAKTYEFSVGLNQALAGANKTLAKLGAQKYIKKQTYYDKASRTVVVTMFRKANLLGKPNSAAKSIGTRAASKILRPGTASSLNPQPLPPKSTSKFSRVRPGSNSSLNPQPLPPKSPVPDPGPVIR